MKRSDATLANAVLTNLAFGYKNSTMIGNVIFPSVKVQKETGKIAKFGKESFTLYDLHRAIGADVNQIPAFGAGTAEYSLEEYEAEKSIDKRLIEQGKDWTDLLSKATNDTMQALAVSKEVQIANLAQATSSYAGTNYTNLSSGYLNDASVDPIEFIRSKMDVVNGLVGVDPNTMVLGKRVWNKLRQHAKIKAYFGTSNSQLITIERLQEILEIPTIAVGSGVYNNGQGAANTNIWGNNIILSYTAPIQEGIDRTEYDPAFGFLLEKEGYPLIQTYQDRANKFEIVEASEIFQPLVLGSESAFLIKTAIDPAVY